MLDARALLEQREETTERSADDRGVEAARARPLSKMARGMFADSVRRCPADVLLDLCDASPPGASGSFHIGVAYIAALWLQDAHRSRLPMSTTEFAKQLRGTESARERDYDTAEAMLQRARDALFRFATDSTAG